MTTSPVVSVTDELIAELEAIRGDASDLTPDSDAQEYLGNLAARLLAERAELKRDAGRYRWIKGKHNQSDGDTWLSVWDKEIKEWISLDHHCLMDYDGELDLDAAIDAAMQS